MPSGERNGLAERIVGLEADSLQNAMIKILKELVDPKTDSDKLKCIKRRIRCVEKRVDELVLVKEQICAGNFRPALFDVMERFSHNQERAGCRIVSEDLQKIGEDLKERLVYYRRAVEYGKIANELMDIMEAK